MKIINFGNGQKQQQEQNKQTNKTRQTNKQVVLEPQVSPEHTWKYVDTVTVFCKNLKQRSLTPRWPLTPHLLTSHVWLYPRIIVSKSHENTSKYVDTVNLFAKTWTKGHWPLDDLWPHICWGHMCDSTQEPLCPSPMKINQSMWIQWTFLLKLEPKVIDP